MYACTVFLCCQDLLHKMCEPNGDDDCVDDGDDAGVDDGDNDGVDNGDDDGVDDGDLWVFPQDSNPKIVFCRGPVCQQ